MSWLERWGGWLGRPAIVRAARSAGERVHQVAGHGLEWSRKSGAAVARRVIAAQRAARLDPRLIMESVRSVAGRSMTRKSDEAWRQAYLDAAERRLTGRVSPRSPQPIAEHERSTEIPDPEPVMAPIAPVREHEAGA